MKVSELSVPCLFSFGPTPSVFFLTLFSFRAALSLTSRTTNEKQTEKPPAAKATHGLSRKPYLEFVMREKFLMRSEQVATDYSL